MVNCRYFRVNRFLHGGDVDTNRWLRQYAHMKNVIILVIALGLAFGVTMPKLYKM